jgi:phosphoribosylaminoimidazolecarboxamide formyltransferase/IMP cyclohydrolase
VGNKRALISVSDKSGISNLAKKLLEAGYEIIASDGTATELRREGIALKTIEDVTGAKAFFAGRVKSLHPAIHGAILFDRNDPEQVAEAKANQIQPIEIVIVNLYDESKFDIGGPALIRAAAKNHSSVSVITSPDQYPELIASLNSGASIAQRKRWAAEAIERTARYDLAILRDLSQPLRYGENPHQSGWAWGAHGLAAGKLIQGDALSYNNLLDGNLAQRLVGDFKQPAAAIVKHGIPVGVAIDAEPTKALVNALAGDSLSAFGGVLATNFPFDMKLAEELSGKFLELLITPDLLEGAKTILAKKTKLRILLASDIPMDSEVRFISGGILFQDSDNLNELGDQPSNWRLVSGKAADSTKLIDLQVAWKIAARARSNSIVIVRDGAAVGIGAGQVNRAVAADLAVSRAKDRAAGSVAASDGFFPFADGLEALIEAGVSAVVSPGGSIRDEEVIACALKAGITLYFTGVRHFSHN